ncbi:hypothetical protein Vretimale_5311 [Volvox reticuliferus]|uniref:Uncharacterized protein n=1 Tax=Volvox reticuliferus TaxID=1737510 RepID=A0A8J4C484_9CHLO|nr:hypothetical protein Vretifemale_3927 [Volvox reticuliferus]GIM00137.1 hypothetical protein Vretimale_5311 [Volvox reticuliferus]
MNHADPFAGPHLESVLFQNMKLHNLPHMGAQAQIQDTCDQDKIGSKGHPLWGNLDHGRPHAIILPGAWAMGDGLVLDTEAYEDQSGRSHQTLPWNVESISSQVARLACTFRSSVGGYIADLTTAWTGDSNMDDGGMDNAEHTTFIEGEIAWMPRASTCFVTADKKQK